MNNNESVSRRNFIGTTALVGAAASFPYVAKGDAFKVILFVWLLLALVVVGLVQLVKF